VYSGRARNSTLALMPDIFSNRPRSRSWRRCCETRANGALLRLDARLCSDAAPL